MTPSAKKAWLQGLREEYMQGKGYLKQQKIGQEGYKFSVLGVLEDLYLDFFDYDEDNEDDSKRAIPIWEEYRNEGYHIIKYGLYTKRMKLYNCWHRGEGSLTLHRRTADWAGLPRDPKLLMWKDNKRFKRHLSELNEDSDFTFAEYADAIETQL